MKGRDDFIECVRINVGIEDKVGFWEDRWLPDRSLMNAFPNLFRNSSQKKSRIQEVVCRGSGNAL